MHLGNSKNAKEVAKLFQEKKDLSVKVGCIQIPSHYGK